MSRLEDRLEEFLNNHWVHHVEDFGKLQGQVSILLKLILGLAVLILGLYIK